MAAAAPQDPNTPSRGMPLPGAAIPIVPTPAQVASAPAPAALSPLRNLPGADFGAQVVGPTSVSLAQNAQNAFAQGNRLQGVAGDVASGVVGAAHAVTVPFSAAGQVLGDTLSDLGHKGASAIGEIYKGITGTGTPAPADPSLSPLPAAQGPALPAGGIPTTLYGQTFDRTRGPTPEQALAIGKAQDAQIAAIPAGGVAPAAPAAAAAAAPVAGGVVPAAPAAPAQPVSLANSVRLQNYMMTHPSVAAGAAVPGTIATGQGTELQNAINATIASTFKNKYDATAERREGEDDKTYLARRQSEAEAYANNLATFQKTGYGLAQNYLPH